MKWGVMWQWCYNEIWHNWSGDAVRAVLLCFPNDRWYWGKVNQGLIVETSDTNEILGSYQFDANWYKTHFVWLSYFTLLLFCTWSGEGSWFLDTFENVLEKIWLTSINIGELKCEWWNWVLCGIDARCNEIWHNWLGDAVQAILLCFPIDRWYWGKVNRGLIVETGDTNEILG